MRTEMSEAWSGLADLADGETLCPLHDVVFVHREKMDDKIGSIYIPDTAKMKMQHGRVIAVGPGKRHPKTGERIPLDVKVGDRVMFDGQVARELTKNRDIVQIIEDEVLLVVYDEDGP